MENLNSEEKIYTWKPIEGLEGEFYILSATFDLKGLRVVLCKSTDPKKGILINFPQLESYRITEERSSMHLLEGPIMPYKGYIFSGEEQRHTAWPFFKIENSEYLKWESYQSDTVSESLGIVHYAIWDSLWVIDILSSVDPDVKLIDIND
jgi:hypothetical protein